MLHRLKHRPRLARRALALGFALALAPWGVEATPGAPSADAGVDAAVRSPFDDPFTAREREALRIRLQPLTVAVSRRGALPLGVWAPGGAQVVAHGWWAGPRRVVTAAAAVGGWPRSRTDRIEVELADGRRFEAAVGLYEAALGLAVLDVPGLPAPKAPAVAGGRDAAVFPGRPLYAADASGVLHRIVVDRHAAGQHAYFLRTLGRLALGTPLFDAGGRVVSFMGAEGPEPMIGLALPAKALRALMERHDWTP